MSLDSASVPELPDRQYPSIGLETKVGRSRRSSDPLASNILVMPSTDQLKWLAATIAALAVLNLLNLLLGKPFWLLTRQIYLGFDDNAAAWFSSILLALGSLAALQCVAKARASDIRPWGLLLLAALLLTMSCDEIARFHETVYGALAKASGIAEFSFAQHAAWVWIGGPVIALAFVAVVLLVRQQLILVPGTLSRVTWGFAILFVGGVVLESSINVIDRDSRWLLDLEVILEETLEASGSLLLLMAMMRWRDHPLSSRAE